MTAAADLELSAALDGVAAEHAAKQEWPRIVKLKHPIEWGEDRIASLTFRRGRAGDMKGIEIGKTVSTNSLLLIASRMSGQPAQLIERVDIDDVGEVMEIALGFYKAFLGGG